MIVDEVIDQMLANEEPFYQYKGRQKLGAMTRKEIPLRPEPDTATGRKGIDDSMWELLVRCWNYTPKDRPSCAVLLDSIKVFGFQDSRSAPVAKFGTDPTFGEGSNISHDFARVEEILAHLVSNNAVRPVYSN